MRLIVDQTVKRKNKSHKKRLLFAYNSCLNIHVPFQFLPGF